MRTIQMTLDEELVEAVDKLVEELNTTRSAFTREALRQALRRIESKRKEAQHKDGYERLPVREGEFDAWENEQDWGD